MTSEASAEARTAYRPAGRPRFEGRIGRTYQDSTPWWPSTVAPREGNPNVLLMLLDDVGFASLGCFGSEINTPNMDRLASNGLRYSNFHTTALCSPTRASLLTGRNHHSVGMSIISNADSGYPSKRGAVSPQAGTLAEILGAQGYRTYAVGKWHLAPADQTSAAGPYDQWPLRRGFDRFYGFLDALTDQFTPDLVYDNHRVDAPRTPEQGYTLNEDLIDHAISFLTDQVTVASAAPFFMYLAFGATHSPHQAPEEFLQRCRGRYDAGWDVIREQRLARQKELGIVPADTELAPRNTGVPAWDDVPDEQRALYCRLQEAYAAFLEHTDDELGRLIEFLERTGQLDNTVVVLLADNGASQEGQSHGSLNTTFYENRQEDPLEYNLARIDDIGTGRVQNNYPLGWAMAANTPLKRYKQNTHAGGVRDPLIISWPARITDAGAVRTQFHHVIDVAPTILDILGVEAPEVIRGVEQMPIHGTSMVYTFDGDGATRKTSQYFEMFGHRAIWADGWKAVAYHVRDADYDDDVWELYNLAEDFSECRDLADAEPERLQKLVQLWWEEAERFDVLPLDDRGFAERRAASKGRPGAPREKSHFAFRPGQQHIPGSATPFVIDRSYRIDAEIEAGGTDHGVIVACGGVCGGYSLYVQDGYVVHDYNYYGRMFRVRGALSAEKKARRISYDFTKTGYLRGTGRLIVDGETVDEVEIPETYRYFIAWEGLDIGMDRMAPASTAYEAPFPFTGEIGTVVFDLADDNAGISDYEPAD